MEIMSDDESSVDTKVSRMLGFTADDCYCVIVVICLATGYIKDHVFSRHWSIIDRYQVGLHNMIEHDMAAQTTRLPI